ncbi:MAG: phenylacetate-CoA oxygenase subunit PaaJ [Ignavibacteriae bacterium]|nr:phenylacetate-CoA oxygenase subunit PaaJ [Ignavibacteriota bacterium]MCB9216687.1 phenylacetate-CoA oxygenase subunit PaaJ [Ignavibacteria bacterium]
MPTVDDIWNALREVMDPEIPTVSLVDLGVITRVEITDDNVAQVKMTPTFSGCPAMDYMKNQVRERLQEMAFDGVEVEMNLDEAWNTNRLTEEGRRGLAKHGLAPPPVYEGVLQLDVLNNIACPNCGSQNTDMKSPFGPTLCRSLHYCRNCGEAFEAFKPL